MPVIGLGTWQLTDCAPLVASALRVGYRHIDTARSYGNEQAIGEGVRASGIQRSELFVTTKVWHEDLRQPDFARSLEKSLTDLQMDQVDLLLVHWPTVQAVPLDETMRALGKARRDGLALNVGVANFNTAMIQQAVSLCPEPLAVVQAEFHPELDQSKLLSLCQKLDLAFTAYCPLGRGRVFSNDTLKCIAAMKRKTVAQVVLRWLIQQRVAAIPRSAHPERIAENFQIFDFDLAPDEMRNIAALKRRDGRIVNPPMAPAWD